MDSETVGRSRGHRAVAPRRRHPHPRRLRRPRLGGQDHAPRGSPATERIPYLGICLGMHVAVSEFARHVAGMEGANSTEMDLETPFPVIDLLPEQKEIADMGGTMRLGADPVKLHDGTRIRELYGDAVVYERHRHRYEVNNHLRRRLENVGLICSGTSPDERLVEADRARARRPSRSTSPPSTTRSSSRGPSARRRCSGSSSAPRWRTPSPAPPPSRRIVARGAPASRVARTSAVVRRASDGRARAAARDLRGAVPHREPVGPRARLRRLAHRSELRALGLEVSEDDSGAAVGSEAGNLLARIPGRAAREHPAVRPHGHRPAGRARRAGARRRRWENANDGILGADNKSAIAVILELARRLSAPAREPPPVGHRDPVHRLRGGLAARLARVRRLAPAERVRLRVRSRHADRRDRRGLADPLPDRRRAARARRPRRRPPRGRAQRGGGRGQRDRGHAARAAGRRDDRQRRARSTAAARSTSSPSAAGSRPRSAAWTPTAPRP